MSSARRSKFDLVLSRKPTVRPDQSRGSDGTVTACVVITPTGLNTRISAMSTSRPRRGAARASGTLLSSNVRLEPGGPGHEASQRLVHLRHHRALETYRDRLHRFRAPDAMNHEGGREFF